MARWSCSPLIASAVFVHLQALGRPTLPGRQATFARWTSVAVALVGGWWFFPTGPLSTLEALAIGIRDTPRQVTLGEVAMATYLHRKVGLAKVDA